LLNITSLPLISFVCGLCIFDDCVVHESRG